MLAKRGSEVRFAHAWSDWVSGTDRVAATNAPQRLQYTAAVTQTGEKEGQRTKNDDAAV